MKLLDWDDLRVRGIRHSKSQIYRKIKEGTFPRPVYPGRFPAWPDTEIDAYIADLMGKRGGAETEAA